MYSWRGGKGGKEEGRKGGEGGGKEGGERREGRAIQEKFLFLSRLDGEIPVFATLDLEGLTEVFGPGRPHERPQDVRRISGPNISSLSCIFRVPQKGV